MVTIIFLNFTYIAQGVFDFFQSKVFYFFTRSFKIQHFINIYMMGIFKLFLALVVQENICKGSFSFR